MSITSISVDRCSPSRLRALLDLARDLSAGDRPLAARLPARDVLPQLIAELGTVTPDAAAALLAAACDPETPLSELRRIKELSKQWSSSATTEAHRAASSLLYHLVVAAAIGRHGTNMSSRPPETRLALYEDLEALLTADDPMRDVFRHAIDRILAARTS